MITEDYVSFETAKLLKEKGFDWDCKQVYDLVRPQSCADGKMYDNFPDENPNAYDELVSAPTLQMAMKWLREVHNLFIEIQYATALFFEPHTTIYFKIYYMSLDYNTSGKDMLPDDYIREYYASYEEACEAAIRYTLENLI